MAISYWDEPTTATTGSYWSNVDATDTTGTTTGTTTTVYCDWYTVRPTQYKPRKLLVNTPAHWTQQNSDDFIRLVNTETDTGWKVTMRINGDIEIIDPDIEIREMEDFVPLLKTNANSQDKRIIDHFFNEHL